MTDMQYHQENERQGRYQAARPSGVSGAAASQPVMTSRVIPNEPKRFRLVPAAIICAFVVVGVMVYARSQSNNELTSSSSETSPTPAVSTRAPLASDQNGQTLDEALNELMAEDDNTVLASGLTTINVPEQAQVAVNNQSVPATRTSTANSDGTVQLATDRPRTVTTEGSNNINITINPVPTETTTKGGVSTAQAAAPVVVTQPKIVTVPATTTYTTYTPVTTYTVYNSTPAYKPSAPWLESCGHWEDNKWRSVRVVLPKFEIDGKAAREYHVQIGTNLGDNNIWDHVYQQTDRVVFSVDLENDREYFVRFRIKMEDGDFHEWSDTFKFRCRRG